MCCLLELAMVYFGISAFVEGKLEIPGTERIVTGKPMQIAAGLLIAPLPVGMLLYFLAWLIMLLRGEGFGIREFPLPILILDVMVSLGAFGAALVIAIPNAEEVEEAIDPEDWRRDLIPPRDSQRPELPEIDLDLDIDDTDFPSSQK